MPTYEYLCSNCGNTWEEMQKISADATEECPKCHQKTAKRQINGGNFILKGGGWYADLYSSSKPSGGGTKTESTTSTSGGEAKSETKSESTAAPAGTGASGGTSSSGSSGSSGGSSST
jgi:putative FmdB family regulatory protein